MHLTKVCGQRFQTTDIINLFKKELEIHKIASSARHFMFSYAFMPPPPKKKSEGGKALTGYEHQLIKRKKNQINVTVGKLSLLP